MDTFSNSLLASLLEGPYDHSEPNRLIHHKLDLRSFNSMDTVPSATEGPGTVGESVILLTMTLSFNTVYDTQLSVPPCILLYNAQDNLGVRG